MASITDSNDTVTKILDDLNHIKRKTFTSGGTKVHEVSVSRMAQLERRIDRLVSEANAATDKGPLIALQQEIQTLKDDNEKARKALADTESSLKAARTALLSKTRQEGQMVAELNSLKKSTEAERTKLQHEFQEAQAQLASVKNQADNAARLKDIDQLQPLLDEKASLSARVTSLNNELAKHNANFAAKQKEINAILAENGILTRELEHMKGRATQLRNALAKGEEGAVKELTLSSQIEKLIGKEGCAILANWHNLAYDNAREKSWTLWQGLSKGAANSGIIAALSKMCKQIWEWCKQLSFNARTAVLPFLHSIVEDLNKGRLKAVKVYRDEMKAVLDLKDKFQQIAKEEFLDAGGAEQDYEETTIEWLFLWGKVFYGRARRHTKSVFAKVKGALAGAKSWFFSLFKPSKGKKVGTSMTFRQRLRNFHNLYLTRQKSPLDPPVILDVEELVDDLEGQGMKDPEMMRTIWPSDPGPSRPH